MTRAWVYSVLEDRRKEGVIMATSTFERKIVINDPNSLKKLFDLMSDQTPAKPLAVEPYSAAERKRAELLVKQCLSRSKH